MTKIFIVRHGRTEWNVEYRLQGRFGDSPLLPETNEDILELSNYLKQFKFEAVFSSPLKRAVDTAKKSLPLYDINIKEEIAEINFGDWEGQKRSDLIEKYPNLYPVFSSRKNDPRLKEFGIEDFDAAANRFVNFVWSLSKEYSGNVILFSHGAASHLAIKRLIGNEKLGNLKNTSTSIIDIEDGDLKLEAYNETAYLTNNQQKGNMII